MKFSVRDITEIGLYAALIFLGVAFFRIPMGAQFVHFGNALVVVGVLLFGSIKGGIAAAVGLFLFDITHGYAQSAPVTVLEALIVCGVIWLLYEKLMNRKDSMVNIVIVAVCAALTKIIENVVKYTYFRNMLVAGMSLKPAFLAALPKIMGTFSTAILTIIAVPILYPVLKQVLSRRHRS